MFIKEDLRLLADEVLTTVKDVVRPPSTEAAEVLRVKRAISADMFSFPRL